MSSLAGIAFHERWSASEGVGFALVHLPFRFALLWRGAITQITASEL
jgi:hypothetical protein